MASKTIMIQEETYNKLLKLKKNNESFNDVIEKLIAKEQDLKPFFGIFTEEEGDKIDNAIEELRILNDQADNERNELVEE
jgi:predicted CopG family antitoxin